MLSFRTKGEIKSFQDTQKLKDFITGNVKEASISLNERVLISNRKAYESINLTCKGKYIENSEKFRKI